MTRPPLNFFQIWNMCFGFLGIQVAFGLQNANTSRIFQTLGANIDGIAILWIAAPATGLLVQPIIGHLSDKTWGRLGRRRPYFFVGAILTTLALLVMPNSPALWVAALMLWLMDASINITMEPFRAFVGDNLPDRQRTTGFAMQSFFIGVGAVFASALPWMLSNWAHIDNSAPPGQVPISVQLSYYIGAGVLLVAVMWTVFTSREYSPAELASMEDAGPGDADAAHVPRRSAGQFLAGGLIWIVLGALAAAGVFARQLEKELYVLAALVVLFGAAKLVAGLLRRSGATANGFYEIVEDMHNLPLTMKQLAVVQFFSWFALFSMWIYTTPAVAAHFYHSADASSPAYNQGADWVGVLFAIYNGVAALAAIVIPIVARAAGRRFAHALNLALGAAGFASFFFISDPKLLWIPMIGVGFAWSSILSTPYSILSGALPARKMGVYMGIFNFFIVIPQLMAATLLGLILKLGFHNDPLYALAIGAASFLIAAAATFVVKDASPLSAAAARAGA
ncbi:MAG TPA: MFS transporter [Caulobacterales bacterium]|nr:MFS transporter [Caulobacterales bacterium]